MKIMIFTLNTIFSGKKKEDVGRRNLGLQRKRKAIDMVLEKQIFDKQNVCWVLEEATEHKWTLRLSPTTEAHIHCRYLWWELPCSTGPPFLNSSSNWWGEDRSKFFPEPFFVLIIFYSNNLHTKETFLESLVFAPLECVN